MENFNKILKNYLAGQGLNQSDIAIRLGLSRTIVNNYLNGQRNFGKLSAERWGKEFGIDATWLISQGDRGTPPTGQGAPPPTDHEIINVPILSPDAAGGFRPNDQADIEQYTIGMMPFSRTIAHTGDIVIPVYGDSMAPRYPAGSYVLIRPIEAWREYIELGRAYVLELVDWRRLIKIVRKGSDTLHYLLESYNVGYDSDEIAKSFINSVWLVVA
jgi:phage repressor protein C with HTH and peptisase S24 domain